MRGICVWWYVLLCSVKAVYAGVCVCVCVCIYGKERVWTDTQRRCFITADINHMLLYMPVITNTHRHKTHTHWHTTTLWNLQLEARPLCSSQIWVCLSVFICVCACVSVCAFICVCVCVSVCVILTGIFFIQWSSVIMGLFGSGVSDISWSFATGWRTLRGAAQINLGRWLQLALVLGCVSNRALYEVHCNTVHLHL